MKISVKAKPGAKKIKIEEIEKGHFEVCLKSRAQEGKANQELIFLIAKHFKVSKSRVEIVSGLKSKNKILEVK